MRASSFLLVLLLLGVATPAQAFSFGRKKHKQAPPPPPVVTVPANPAPPTGPNPSPGSELSFYPGATNYHQIGRKHDTQGWEVDVTYPREQFMTYGPYTTAVSAGSATATFTLLLDNVTNDNLRILTVDVFDSTQQRILASRELRRGDFHIAGARQQFDLPFVNPSAGDSLEFRVFWWGDSYAEHSVTTVTQGGSTPPVIDISSDPLGAFWNGQAHFQYMKTLVWPGNEGAGWTAVKDGVWYLFNREWEYGPRPSYCSGLDYARSVVRESHDQGRTWSDKTVVAEPNPGNNDANCAILDGSSYFDRDTGVWHMLTQCLGSSAAWRLCHYTRHDPSPVGPFTPDPERPVVDVGQLWRDICAGGGKSCPTSTIDEGTPDILYKKNGYYYVTFHGYDPQPREGYRGVARTRDFRTWETGGADLPGDAMFGPRDCQSWNPGCIGGGEATTLVSGSYHYMLIEAPDLGLGCTDNQWWVFGLMRAPGLARSGGWESYAGNPLLTPSHRRACGLQYSRFIRDGAELFLLYEDSEKGRRLFHLLPGAGIPLTQ